MTSPAAVDEKQQSPRVRKMGKWATFSCMFAFLPLLFDAALQYHSDKLSFSSLVSGGSTYLTGFGIAASAFGELLFDRRHAGQADGYYITAEVLSIMILVWGAFYYALTKSSAGHEGNFFPVVYVFMATVTAFCSVWVSEKS